MEIGFHLFHIHGRLNAPWQIVQSQFRRPLLKAASTLGLHFFLWYSAHTHRFTNDYDLLYSLPSVLKLRRSIILNVKVAPNDTLHLAAKEL